MVIEDQKHARNKTRLSTSSGGGGGIAGLLVLGGALAVTGFMAVVSFANKKDKAKGTHDQKPKSLAQDSMDEGSWKSEGETTQEQGLSSLILQHSTTNHGNACCSTHGTSNMGVDQINSSELLSTQSLNLEEKLDLKTKNEEESPICFHQEIVFSDDSPPESAVSSNENGVDEECLSSLFSTDHPCFKGEESQGVKSMGIIEAQNEDATPTDQTEDEINEDEDEDDVEPHYVLQSGQDSSEATGRSSLDSNEEAVWPAELIEEPEQQFKGEMLIFQSQTEGGTAARRKVSAYDSDTASYTSSDSSSDCSGNDPITPEAVLAEKPNSCVLLSNEPSVSNSSKLLTWIILMLLIALLLLFVLFTYGFPEAF